MRRFAIMSALALFSNVAAAIADVPTSPRFSRHVTAVFSRLNCNGGTCHGAVQGQNGFRLTLFGADPELDYHRLVREYAGRRINPVRPSASLLLQKATAQIAHEGGRRMEVGSPEYEVLKRWIAAGAPLDDISQSHLKELRVLPPVKTVKPGETYQLKVEATFCDGSVEDVTPLCSFESNDPVVVEVDQQGKVTARGAGDASLIVRFRAQPTTALVVVPRPGTEPFPPAESSNFVDDQILAKLKRLNIPPSGLADDYEFLRRASLDVTGALPLPEEICKFVADKDPNKRAKKIDELLSRPGYAAVWTLKFCDILKASDFGVYADGLSLQADAPRFYAWVRARLEENTPYDEFVERILTATSRDGRSLEQWAAETRAIVEGYKTPRSDLEWYAKRKTLDLYWQRKDAAGVPGTLQIAHAFLGLRLECAQCHRHPHDVWQQNDLLSFANFFMRVRSAGFRGDNAKKYPEVAGYVEKLNQEAKRIADQAKNLKNGKGKQLETEAKNARSQYDQLRREIAQIQQKRNQVSAQLKTDPKRAAQLSGELKNLEEQLRQKERQFPILQAKIDAYEKFRQEVADMERRSKLLPEIGKRLLHAEIHHVADESRFASVTSPLGTQTSKEFRLLGEKEAIKVKPTEDPRHLVVAWMRRPENPFFAKAIVNRVWAHYFGRGLVDPPDDLSPFNPSTHPELLDELCQGFIKNGFDLKWLHRTILNSRTYQRSSRSIAANQFDRSNYAYFYLRRLPAEVLVDALNHATGTTEDLEMRYDHWPDNLKTIEIPFPPRNRFVNFMLEQFGRPKRNSAVQCDCERDSNASVLQILSMANHPRVRQKIADPNGRIARMLKDKREPRECIEELFLVTLCRLPDTSELDACETYLREADSLAVGLRGILWSLINTREFLLQH
ncbi:MAG: hypothetical protein KatS3mg105_3413 [Gemmatales bacterium]|nr:MAG: hypothetical protein KatS3mg105_3413 [Gemmatales bacterium]